MKKLPPASGSLWQPSWAFLSKAVSEFHHLMVDLEPTVAYNHPPLLTLRKGKGGREREEGRERGWRFCHQYELKSQSHLYIEQCDCRVQSRKLLCVVLFSSASPQAMFQYGLCVCLWHSLAKGSKMMVVGSWRGLRQDMGVGGSWKFLCPLIETMKEVPWKG